MILFCDTSALAKLYVTEEHSAAVLQVAQSADAVAVSRIAWVELMSALGRRERECPADAAALATARQRLRDDWADYLKLDIDQALVESAGELAETFALRAYDSVQLACARRLQAAAAEQPVVFACFDRRLSNAARLLGLEPLSA